MTHTRKNKGVCSRTTTVTIEDGIVKSMEVVGGCDGNLSGIASLVRDMPAQQVIDRFKGVKCGMKSTSCPDQIAACIEEALQNS